MKSSMGAHKYKNLAEAAFTLLSIPKSNSFQSSLSTETISSLIGCQFNKIGNCCEHAKFEDSLLVKAKQCMHEQNLSYKCQQ